MATSKPVDEEELPNFSLGLEFLNPKKGAQYLDIRRLTHELIVKCHESYQTSNSGNCHQIGRTAYTKQDTDGQI